MKSQILGFQIPFRSFSKETSLSPSKPITHRDSHGTYREHSPKRAGRASLHTAALGSGGGWDDHWQTQFVGIGRAPTPGYLDQPHCWLPELPSGIATANLLSAPTRAGTPSSTGSSGADSWEAQGAPSTARTTTGPWGSPQPRGPPAHGLTADWRAGAHRPGGPRSDAWPSRLPADPRPPPRSPALVRTRAPRRPVTHLPPRGPTRPRLPPAVSWGGRGRPALRGGREAYAAFSGPAAPIRAARGRCFPRRPWGKSAAVTTRTSPGPRPGKLPGGFPQPRGRRCAGRGLSARAAAARVTAPRFPTAVTCARRPGARGAGRSAGVFPGPSTEPTLGLRASELRLSAGPLL